jgi:uncharacterized RDD family membrane protein YckC
MPETDPPMAYAGFWRRLTAFAIDMLVFLPPYWLHEQATRVSPLVALVAVLAINVAGMTYVIGCHARWGQTIGKMVLGIRVVQVDGAPVTVRQALLRSAVDLAFVLVGIPSTAYVLLTWSGPEWGTMTDLDRNALVVDQDPLNRYSFALETAWQASEFVVLLFNAKRRALHDFIAGTVVVRSRGEVV